MQPSAVAQATSRLNGSFLDRWQAGSDPKRYLVIWETDVQQCLSSPDLSSFSRWSGEMMGWVAW